MLFDYGSHRFYPLRILVQAGDIVKSAAAGCQEVVSGFHGYFFQSFKAIAGETGAHDIDAPHTLLRQLFERGRGVGLQPLGLAETGLKGDEIFLLAQPEFASHQTRSFVALAMVGVTQQQCALGYAVETHDQFVGTAVLLPVRTHGCGKCFDVALVIVIVLDQPELRGITHARVMSEDGVENRRRGGARVLRIGRQDQQAVAALGLELVEYGGQARITVTHRIHHTHIVAAGGHGLLQ